MLEAMARITPSQPNDAMARIISRRNRTIDTNFDFTAQESAALALVQQRRHALFLPVGGDLR